MEQNALLLAEEKGKADRAWGWDSGKLDADPRCGTLWALHTLWVLVFLLDLMDSM